MTVCIRPESLIAACCVCNAAVYTCEHDCPAHGAGTQLHNKNWVCSERCWEKAAAQFEKGHTPG
jgi:hypothetical protein